VRGEGFEVRDGGKTIIFTGESSAKIKLGSPPPGSAAPKTPVQPAPAQSEPAVKP
jgi:hypothetical protein